MKKDLNSIILTRQELNVMKAIWKLGGATAKSIHSRISPGTINSYFSIMTVLRTLEKKGIVVHSKQGKAYFYSPIISRKQAIRNHVRKVLDSYFEGDSLRLLTWLSENMYEKLDEKTVTDILELCYSDSDKRDNAWESSSSRVPATV